MLYYLFEYLEKSFQLPGASLFQFLSFRAAIALLVSLILNMLFGKKVISILRRNQMGETVRDLGLEGQSEKEGTPTMGGIIIILATMIPVLLVAKLHNIYIILLMTTTIWMGIIGFLDDFIKVRKKNKQGLKGRFKIIGQLGLGLFVGMVLYIHPDVTIRQENPSALESGFSIEEKSTKTTIPLLKNNELDYADLITWLSPDLEPYAWIVFVLIVTFIVIAVSNGANLTDGIDGLAAGSAAIIVLTLGLFAWVSGNIIFSDYLNVMYIPRVSEIVIFIAAFAGSLVGFLWFNAYPAQVFMGDTGSLTIGGIIAVLAIMVRKELLIPVLCGIFLIENLSVVIQVSYFKYTKKKRGIGKRIFKMAPLHHHYQKLGYHESKIVARFWIVGIMLAIVSLVTLKIR